MRRGQNAVCPSAWVSGKGAVKKGGAKMASEHADHTVVVLSSSSSRSGGLEQHPPGRPPLCMTLRTDIFRFCLLRPSSSGSLVFGLPKPFVIVGQARTPQNAKHAYLTRSQQPLPPGAPLQNNLNLGYAAGSSSPESRSIFASLRAATHRHRRLMPSCSDSSGSSGPLGASFTSIALVRTARLEPPLPRNLPLPSKHLEPSH